MFTTALSLFAAGILTILLPCILPLLPIVLGVSVADRHPLRPLFVVLGMIAGFVGITFVLQVLLGQFVELADIIRLATFDALLIFGFGFITSQHPVLWAGALLGSLFFLEKGIPAVVIAAVLGIVAVEIGGMIAARLQQLGADIQSKARSRIGAAHPLIGTFIVGLTLGLVWAPCAGPALSLVLTVIREQPGLRAFLLLLAYGAGAGIPLLAIGYGGQRAARSVHAIARYSDWIKKVAGMLLILSAVAFRYGYFMDLQVWLEERTSLGSFGSAIEERLFEEMPRDAVPSSGMPQSNLPKIVRAPELVGLGPWHNLPNEQPLTLAGLRGKVVLVDFWTYSCINCIRTLPHIEGFWQKYKNQPFMLLGVHTPEFVFEKSEANVARAIKDHGLTYPTAQDNDYATWSAFANRYWPAKYLIDAEGYVRYVHFGEGNYEETDEAIASLLTEIGVKVSGEREAVSEEPERRGGPVSAETYLGERSWSALGNAQGDPSGGTVSYAVPTESALHSYYLVGQWQLVDGEHQVLRSDAGEIRMRFLGGEINLVLGSETGKPVAVDVFIDGKEVKSISVDHHDLYGLFKGPYGEHELLLKIQGTGLEGYAFTFGR